MAAKAMIKSGYRWRLALVAVALLAFGGYFLYDAIVGYPGQNKLVEESRTALETLQQEQPQTWPAAWTEHARAQGYLLDPVNAKTYSQLDIYTQWLCAAITLPIGAWFGIGFIRSRNRWVATDETGLHTSWGEHAPWETIREIDKTRWKSKGIAIVRYGDGKRITLDDWKYDREPTTRMVAEVEQHLGPDAVVGQTSAAEEAATQSGEANA